MDAEARQLIALDVSQLTEAPTGPTHTEAPAGPARVSANAGSRSLIRNALLSYVSTGVNMATGLFTTPILLSRLGSDHFGTWALMGSVAAYTGLIEIGLGTALAKRVAEHEATDDRASVSRVLGTALTMYLFVAVGVLVISSVIALLVDRIFHIPKADIPTARLCLLVLGANQAMVFLFTVQNALLYGAGRLDLLTMAGVVINVATAVLNIAAVMMGFGIVTLSGIVLFSSLLMGITTRQIIRRRFPGTEISSRHFSFSTAKQLLQFGSRNAVIYLFAALGLGSDAVVIGIFLPVTAVANYAVASKLTALMRTLATKPIDVTMPSVAHASAMGDHKRLFQIQTQATLLSLAVALPMAIAVSVFADRVIAFWVGMGHEAASSVLVALSLTTVFLLPGNVSLSLMTGTERNGFLVKVALITAPLNLLLSVLFTHWLMRPVGVALGSMVTVMVADFLVMPFYTCRQFGFSVRRYVAEGFGPLLLPALAAAAAAVGLRYATPHAGKYWLPPILVTIALVFVAALVLSIGSDRRRDYMVSLRVALQKRTAGWSGKKDDWREPSVAAPAQ
jgi:O-antigen/teichoic acid export membrane protein